MREAYAGKLEPQRPEPSMPVGAENLIRCTDQGRCARKNVGTYRANYVQHSVAPAVRQDPDGDLEILVRRPIGVFGTHRVRGGYRSLTRIEFRRSSVGQPDFLKTRFSSSPIATFVTYVQPSSASCSRILRRTSG